MACSVSNGTWIGTVSVPEKEAALSVRLLKERLEIEVGLRREGLRCLVFVSLCVCFGAAFFISIQPTQRNGSRWYISRRMNFEKLEQVSSPKTVFEELMRLSSASREFFPMSSVYVGDSLSKTLVGESRSFPAGPVRLPAESKPELKLEWTFTFRLSLSSPNDPLPKKRLIARSYISGDTSGYSCYAIYCQGMSTFIVEYGRNTIDDGYPVVVLSFSASNVTTDAAAANLVAVQGNTTHVAVRLQDAGWAFQPLPTGTIPSDCPDSTFEVGDLGISLASLKYHPRRLAETELSEIERSGQTLSDVASGTALAPGAGPASSGNEEEHTKTQAMVRDYGRESLSISKLAGLMALTASERAAGSGAGGSEGAPPSEGNAAGSGAGWSEGGYLPVLGREALLVEPGSDDGRLAASLGAAFSDLAQRSADGFTFSWWSRAGSPLSNLVELMLTDATTGRMRLEVLHEAFEDSVESVNFWLLGLNGAPWCQADEEGNIADSVCGKSPSVFCLAPAEGMYDGIWRHAAVEYSFGSEPDGRSRLALYVDGRFLCGITFAADEDLNLMPTAADIPEMAVPYLPGPYSLELKDVRLYPRALNASEIKALANDPKLKECFDLETNADDGDWVSDFGQSCIELSGLGRLSPRSDAPPACEIAEVRQRCPVSCATVQNPTCFDGVPPLPQPGAYLTLGTKITGPELVLVEQDLEWGIELSAAALASMIGNSEFIGGESSGEFTWLSNEIRKLKYAEIVPSESALAAMLALEGQQSFGSLTLYLASREPVSKTNCPGAGIDEIMSAVFPDGAAVSLDICHAEAQAWRNLDELVASLSPGGSLTQSLGSIGWGDVQFPSGLVSSESSFTMYYWAKTSSSSAATPPYLTGIDFERNICFAMRGRRAWLQKKDAASILDGGGGGTEPEPEQGVEGGRQLPRVGVEIPDAAFESIVAGTWSFYALAVDREEKLVRYAVNGIVTQMPLDEGDWGCRSLELLLNTGPDADFSPLRVLGYPLAAGSLQRLYLDSRDNYLNIFAGEAKSRAERLTPVERAFDDYNARMVALAPPILFQKRAPHSTVEGLQCRGKLMERYNARLLERRVAKCSLPFKCGEPGSCFAVGTSSSDRFFGQTAVELEPGQMYYPEFVWTLAGDTIVRDGVALNPKSDYIDSATRIIKLFIPFFVPSTQVATLTMATIDLTSVKVSVSLEFSQLKILSSSEIATVLGCTICAIVLGFIGIALAFPAAVQELREMKDSHLQWLFSKINKIAPSKIVRLPTLHERKYTSNTTQPDILDVLLNLGLIFLLLAFLVDQLGNNSAAEDTFTSIADIDWSGNMDFQEKIGMFLMATRKAVDVVSMEDKFMSAAFWTLVFCCIRMILYMKMHPSISSIAETFESTGGEILNFLFSFGLVFLFLAFIAHIRFGYLYDEFATIEQSLITQFSLLIGDSSPDYTNNALMCIYVVGYIFICTFSLLNFLLAIVVNGYTKVTERVLENRVAQNLFRDLFTVAADAVRWGLNRSWPSKLNILRSMQEAYPDVFIDEEEIVRPLARGRFADIVVQASRGKASREDADRLFNHYARFEVMLMKATKDSDPAETEVQSLLPGH